MIALPKPGTDAWRVLELVVDRPGTLDAEAIGQRMWRPKITSPSEVLRVQACIRGSGREWSKRASVILGRLTAAGLVMPQQAPRPSDDLPAAGYGTTGWAVGLVCSRVVDDEEVYLVAPDGTPQAVDLLVRLVNERPGTVAEWAGPSPSGATKRAIAALYEAEIVVPPSFRWPAQAGIDLIEHSRESA